MAFVATIDPQSALAPDYAGTKRIERWSAVALVSDVGPATITARHLQIIDDYDVQSFGGSPPSSVAIRGNQLILYLPGTTTALTYRVKLESRY